MDYFAGRDYAVTAVASGQEAVAAFAIERPDVVLLDIRMPEMDGFLILKHLRIADPTLAIIMVTANEDETLARQTLAIGAFDYVAKPFDFEHLSRIVEAAVLHSARGPLPSRPGEVRLHVRDGGEAGLVQLALAERPMCAECITKTVGLSAPRVDMALAVIAGALELSVSHGRCDACSKRTTVFRLL